MSITRILGVTLLATLVVPAFAQFEASNVTLKSRISISTFASTGGNDCWGYVSPSGREYAIMGLQNKVAFVEITNPASPVILDDFPHPSSTWGDIKTYGHYAYATSEAAGTGIQVFDMSQIDTGVVTLVRTIPSPGRSHNLQVDEQAGFLYTCGSRDGTGTTMCFSLANPSNPVQVGLGSLTTNYQHDGQPVTYTSGPLAGRTLWFGFSEGRGVDIYDFTNKNAPFLVKRVIYPNMNYCHQGWLSADRKFLYVDDELDEQNLLVNTRSLIFNVEDPLNAYFVGTFSTGTPAIDHNQYWADGFIFQANYRSGLRIFDVENPTAPVAVGYIDTYPNSNAGQFNGAWSNYPWFPSGTAIVSDIERGLFVVDPSAALTRNRVPTAFQTLVGTLTSGNLAALAAADGTSVAIEGGRPAPGGPRDQIQMTSTARAFDASPLKLALRVVAQPAATGYTQTIDLMNWQTGQYQVIDTRLLSAGASTVDVPVPGSVAAFVNPATLDIKARLRWVPNERARRKSVMVDQVQVRVTR